MPDSQRPSINDAYEALIHSVGIADMGPRAQIEMTGRDRASFLHGLCTNDIKQLTPGQGCEAFLTNVQGRTLAYVYVFCGHESLVLDTSAGQATTIITHLDRYIVREKVAIQDRSVSWGELLLGGPRSEDCLRTVCDLPVPAGLFRHIELERGDCRLSARRVPFLSPECFSISGEAMKLSEFRARLESAGAVPCPSEVVETRRVESGSPLFGVDISETNLPQEIRRTATAISFQKGCYLGQETVARLDAMGHVNRQLMGLKFSGTRMPPAGIELQVEDKTVARITSVVWSLRLQSPLALSFVRRGWDRAGAVIPTEFGLAEVLELPLEP